MVLLKYEFHREVCVAVIISLLCRMLLYVITVLQNQKLKRKDYLACTYQCPVFFLRNLLQLQ